MITSKQELKAYIRSDQISLGEGYNFIQKVRAIFMPTIWKFEKKLRVLEYYHNCRKDVIGRIIFYIKKVSFSRYSLRLGFSIPINVFGPGLDITHAGTIIVNSKAKIGANARIHPGVTIGYGGRHGYHSGDTENLEPDNVPIIGDNVYFGPGAKLFGKIRIGDNVAIGANAVVTHDVENHVTVAGIPAKVINTEGSSALLIRGWDTEKSCY